MVLLSTVGSVRLADVMSSCLAALQGEDNPLGLSPVTKAAVLVVDGLGAANLRERAGHARWLSGKWASRSLSADVGFPSTTASALTTLTTGVSPGRHGIVGYTIRDPASQKIINHLKEWSPTVDPATWQRHPTLFEQAATLGIPSLSQGEPRFATSDFTRAVWRGAEFHASGSLAEQFSRMREFFDHHDRGLAYLYWPALDRTGHSSGSESDSWIHRLEELDGWLRELEPLLGSREGAIVTADHGMLDVEEDDKILIDASSSLLNGVVAWGGEPRAPQLYVEHPAMVGPLMSQWQEMLGERAVVVSRDEVVANGWLGDVEGDVVARIGDIVLATLGHTVIYHTPSAPVRSVAMVGHHGSISTREREVPVIPLGAWG
jgi:hypothetical protein